jgi:hypothetical protein
MKFMITLLLLVLLAAPALAVEPWENWMSTVYEPYSTAYDFNCIWVEDSSFITIDLWLVRPVNPDFNGVERAVENISCFDVQVSMSEGLSPSEWVLSVPGTLQQQDGALNACFDEPLPVVEGRALLASCQVLAGGADFEVPDQPWARCGYMINAWDTLAPVPNGMMPGSLCYVDADDPVDGRVIPNSFVDQDLVFAIVESTVAADRRSWDSLKAIYK